MGAPVEVASGVVVDEDDVGDADDVGDDDEVDEGEDVGDDDSVGEGEDVGENDSVGEGEDVGDDSVGEGDGSGSSGTPMSENVKVMPLVPDTSMIRTVSSPTCVNVTCCASGPEMLLVIIPVTVSVMLSCVCVGSLAAMSMLF